MQEIVSLLKHHLKRQNIHFSLTTGAKKTPEKKQETRSPEQKLHWSLYCSKVTPPKKIHLTRFFADINYQVIALIVLWPIGPHVLEDFLMALNKRMSKTLLDPKHCTHFCLPQSYTATKIGAVLIRLLKQSTCF